MAGAGRVRRSRRLREAPHLRAAAAAGVAPEDWRDWAGGVPVDVLAQVAEALVAQPDAVSVARWRREGVPEAKIQEWMENRKRLGPSRGLFVFALVCKPWRKAQLKVGGRLRTRADSDVAMPGSVELAKWALAGGCPRDNGNGYTMAHVAADHGRLELVKWLCGEGGFAMDERVMWQGAGGGNLEVVQWLRGEGCEWDEETCSIAALMGHLQVLQWLRANGCPWDKETCKSAALRGHLETLRWARENGCDWDAVACSFAAHGGHLQVLQWLRAHGCPWDVSTCYCAVDQGHVEVLRWARANGCEWIAETRDKAASKFGYTDDLGNLYG